MKREAKRSTEVRQNHAVEAGKITKADVDQDQAVRLQIRAEIEKRLRSGRKPEGVRFTFAPEPDSGPKAPIPGPDLGYLISQGIRGYDSSEPDTSPGPRQPQLRAAIEAQEKIIAGLSEAVSMLDQKLSPIIAPLPQTGNTCGQESCGPVVCEFAGRLEDSNTRLSTLYDKIARQTEAVEL